MQQLIKWYELNGWYQRAQRFKDKEKSIGVCTDATQGETNEKTNNNHRSDLVVNESS